MNLKIEKEYGRGKLGKIVKLINLNKVIQPNKKSPNQFNLCYFIYLLILYSLSN